MKRNVDKTKIEIMENKKDQKENEEKLYYYILVKYEDCSGYKEYNYISDDSTVKEGDRVLVDRAGNLAVAEVLETGYFNKVDAPFPLEKTKRIIKKVDEDFELEDIVDYDQDGYYFDLEENSSSNCIKMNIDDTYFEFGISNYISGKDNDENWANIKIKIYNYYFKYVTNSELMTCAETEYLLHELELLLNDKMDKPKRIGFYEPDIDFYLYPKMNLWDTGEYVYIKEGHEIQDIYMELNINLTDRGGAYIGQKYSIIFNRKEIEKIVDYIRKCVK